MKRVLTAALILAFMLASGTLGETITVLHLNDTHAHLMPYGPKDANGVGMYGGVARIATLVGMNKMTEPNVMLLHSGDLCVGDFMFQKYLGIPELEIMKQLGYDALELGNHEFDLYPSTLKYMLSQAGFPAAGFPVLCANLDYSADPEMGYFVQPYTIKQYGTVKVGVFGLLTDFTNSGSNPAPDQVIPPLNVAQAWIDSLKIGHGCDVVILLSHLGIDMEKAVASYTSGIDVIVGGHTHTQLDQPIKIGNTLVLQAGEFGHYLGRLHLNVNGGSVTGFDYQLIPVDQNVPSEPSLVGMLSYLAAGVEVDPRFGPVFSQPIGSAAFTLDKDFGHGLVMDNPMGNLISDAFRLTTGTNISFQPQGFINQPIFSGPVFGNDVFQAVPYGFDQASGLGLKLATFQTDGASLMAGLEFSVYNLPYLEDFFLHGSNLSFAYNSSKPAGSRVDYTSIMANGQPINPFGSYTVTVPDGVVPFLSQIPGFNISNLTITDQFMYTVVRDFVTAESPVKYYRQGRVLDLAALNDPVNGALALVDMVGMYQTNGSISKPATVAALQRDFGIIAKQVRENRIFAALARLYGIKLYIKVEMKLKHIDTPAGNTLVYLICRESDAIRAATGFVCKQSEEEMYASTLPESFDLKQNYPNPFNPTTRIEFSLPSESDVTLDIFNVLGQRVRTLVNEPMAAGTHTVDWDGNGSDGRQVASGVYFYRIQAGNQSAAKKMIMMK